MSRRRKPGTDTNLVLEGYDEILAELASLLENARRAAARSANALMTASYWAIGRRIVEHEQGGEERAGYGAALIRRLSEDLTARFGRGFGRSNLFQMRAFYLAYREKVRSASGQLAAGEDGTIVQIASGLSFSTP